MQGRAAAGAGAEWLCKLLLQLGGGDVVASTNCVTVRSSAAMSLTRIVDEGME